MQIKTHPPRETGEPLRFLAAAESKQTRRTRQGDGEGGEGEAEGPQKLAKRGQELKEEMDALVDEIDEVLEENAEEFVKNYVQRGGQ
jgi:ubiquitin-like protein Pup